MRVSHVLKGDRPVTAELALRLGRAFGQTPQYWLNLQSAYDLKVAQIQMKDSLKLVKLSEFSMYQPGDEVIITHDSFQNMSGTLYSICEKTNKASIMLNILGRNVKVEIDLNKLKKKK
jgi:transcription antitermination factor NusG